MVWCSTFVHYRRLYSRHVAAICPVSVAPEKTCLNFSVLIVARTLLTTCLIRYVSISIYPYIMLKLPYIELLGWLSLNYIYHFFGICSSRCLSTDIKLGRSIVYKSHTVKKIVHQLLTAGKNIVYYTVLRHKSAWIYHNFI